MFMYSAWDVECHMYRYVTRTVICSVSYVRTCHMLSYTCTDTLYVHCHMYRHVTWPVPHVRTYMSHTQYYKYIHTVHTGLSSHAWSLPPPYSADTHTVLSCKIFEIAVPALRREACVHNVLYDKRMWLAFEEGRVCTCATSHHTSGHNA